MVTRWDPDQYLKYQDERSRPFMELVERVDHSPPARVVDLGCGPGTTTALLLERWPDAYIFGLDSSPEMIEKASALVEPGRLEFGVGDLRDLEWAAGGSVDVILCSATLHWVPDHTDLFPEILGALSPGGAFAFQVPANFNQPSHTLLYELARSDRWADLIGDLVRADPVLEPEAYLRLLFEAGSGWADVW